MKDLKITEVQVDCRELTKEQVENMALIVEENGYEIANTIYALKVNKYKCYFSFTGFVFLVGSDYKDKTFISYDQFLELFDKKEVEEVEFNTVFDEKLMEVSNFEDFKSSKIRVVFARKNGVFLAWDSAENLEKSKEKLNTSPWKYTRPIQQINMTRQEIADKLGIKLHQLDQIKKIIG